MKANLARRLAALEARAKPSMLSSWVDFVLWLDEHEDDEEVIEIDLSPALQEIVNEILDD